MQPLAIREPAVVWFLLRAITTLRLSFSAETRVQRLARLMHIPGEIRGSGSPAELARWGEASPACRSRRRTRWSASSPPSHA
ncbi:hypothetical protein WME94_50685 [Sorangium sp. So ce429]